MSYAKRSAWPIDGQIWEVYWLGAVKPGQVSSELGLEVTLRRLSPTGAADGETRVVTTGIGQLPAIHVGQQWRDGHLLGKSTLQRFDNVVTLDASHWRVCRAGTRLDDSMGGKPQYLIPSYIFKLPMGEMSSRCVAVEVDGVADALILPCLEIARAWYFRSTDLVLRLTSGPFFESERLIYNDAYPLYDDDGVPQVVLRTGLSSADAPVVAMLRHDASARRSASKIADSLVRATLACEPAHLEAWPPAVGVRRIRARGYRFKSHGADRFLVAYLEEVPFPDIGARLAWDLDNSNQGKGVPDEGGNVAWPKTRFPTAVTPDHELQDEEEPQTTTAPVHESGRLPLFGGLPSLDRLPPRQRTTRPAGVRPIAAPPHGNEVSTAAGENTLDGPAQLRIQPEKGSLHQLNPRELFAAGFESLIDLADEIDSRHEFHCRLVPGSDRTSGPHEAPRSLFPNYNRKFRGQWQRIQNRPRQFMVAEISTTMGTAYAIEIERRGAGVGGRRHSESFALGVLAGAQGRCFTQRDFEVVARRVINLSGVWPRSIAPDVRCKGVRHAYASCSALADAVLEVVANLLLSGADDHGAAQQLIGRAPT